VYESLDRNNSVITQYTTQYEDRINNTIIRAYRSYPHIDLQLQLQLQHGNKEKGIFDRSFGLWSKHRYCPKQFVIVMNDRYWLFVVGDLVLRRYDIYTYVIYNQI